MGPGREEMGPGREEMGPGREEMSPGREEMAAGGFWLVCLKRVTLIRNFRETATCVRSFHVDNKPVGST